MLFAIILPGFLFSQICRNLKKRTIVCSIEFHFFSMVYVLQAYNDSNEIILEILQVCIQSIKRRLPSNCNRTKRNYWEKLIVMLILGYVGLKV